MAKGGKDTSTDKLLNVIRGKGDAPAGSAGGAAAGAKRGKGKGPGRAAASAKGPRGARVARKSSSKVVVGVDIGPDSLRIARVNHSGGRPKLLGFHRVPFETPDAPDRPDFPQFLRASLSETCGSLKGYEVWSLVSSAKSELWHIQIPKVPRRQIPDAVYWTVKKEKQFDEREFILDFEVQEEVMEKGQPKLSIMVYLTPRKQVEQLKTLFSKAGVKLAGATISPIAIQTLFRSRWVESGARTYSHLYVGRNWSRIDIFKDNHIVLSRGIKAGTNSMVEALMENYSSLGGTGEATISLSMEDELPQLGSTQGLTQEQAKHVLRSKLLGYDMSLDQPGGELGQEDVLRMIRPAVERLVRQVERTFEYHTTTMGKERVEKIFFSGEITTNRMLMEFIHTQLGITSHLLDPLSPEYVGPGALGPVTESERLEYNLVLALALSDNAITPNLLFTYKAKEKERQVRRLDNAIMASAGIVIVILFGIYLWQQTVIGAKQSEIAGLQVQLNRYQPQVDRNLLIQWAQKVNQKNIDLKRASRMYEGLSVVSELARLTPPGIKIADMQLDLGPGESEGGQEQQEQRGRRARSAQREEPERVLILDAVILGDSDAFDTMLTSYLIKLENSRLFKTPVIHKRVVEDFATSGEVLHFVIHINLV
ncbi:hypothetical protein DPQ33_08855 [Oceanidesulfovibrio indonesiensis]|uniref:Type IV pilus assembly protein PilM n=1 Tax=Oceanidesulfovibrio indonesiensis TaxID=54767 RepID=A0A7M3MEG6_9BACT|nr:hypothetical protein [Oceanidesulfovibrio indonesiensis]TVM17285.1 hypothetical protein DPQ33_08855 [Oceanidesulfovibrio indonesiensis]